LNKEPHGSKALLVPEDLPYVDFTRHRIFKMEYSDLLMALFDNDALSAEVSSVMKGHPKVSDGDFLSV
jgi:hypothetical protein